jgi:tripeptide aminopeptidase
MINSDRLLHTFTTLVQVDNPSGQEQAMAQKVMDLLRERGLQPEQDAKGNVIARLPGTGARRFLKRYKQRRTRASNIAPRKLCFRSRKKLA